MHQLNSLSAIVGTFAELFVAAVHVILFERRVYPASVFCDAKAYNYPIKQIRSAKVCNWIQNSVAAVEKELLRGIVNSVSIVIISAQAQPIERYVFDVTRFPVISQDDVSTAFEKVEDADSEDEEHGSGSDEEKEEDTKVKRKKVAPPIPELEEFFKGCTFTIALDVKTGMPAPSQEPPTWVPSENKLANRHQEEDGVVGGSDQSNIKITPIRKVDVATFAMEVYVEEHLGRSDETEAST